MVLGLTTILVQWTVHLVAEEAEAHVVTDIQVAIIIIQLAQDVMDGEP